MNELIKIFFDTACVWAALAVVVGALVWKVQEGK
jgi:hypothetical protein